MEWSVLLSRVRAAMLVFGFFFAMSALSTAQSAKNEEPMLTATLPLTEQISRWPTISVWTFASRTLADPR